MIYVYYVELFCGEISYYVESEERDFEGFAYHLLQFVYQQGECWLVREVLIQEIIVPHHFEAFWDLRVDIFLRVEDSETLN